MFLLNAGGKLRDKPNYRAANGRAQAAFFGPVFRPPEVVAMLFIRCRPLRNAPLVLPGVSPTSGASPASIALVTITIVPIPFHCSCGGRRPHHRGSVRLRAGHRESAGSGCTTGRPGTPMVSRARFVADSHALWWYFRSPERLSVGASAVCQNRAIWMMWYICRQTCQAPFNSGLHSVSASGITWRKMSVSV